MHALEATYVGVICY